jgi:hypothetical protein
MSIIIGIDFINGGFFGSRNAWATLGDMPKEEAMLGFVEGVAVLLPHLQPYFEAQKQEEETKQENV